MKRFISPEQAQRFLPVHKSIANVFRGPADLSNADHRCHQAQEFQTWAAMTGVAFAV